MKFTTSLDSLAKGITLGVTLLFLIIIFGQYKLIDESDGLLPVYTTTALLVIYLIAFSFRPMYYFVTANQVIIHRLFKAVKIDRNKIKCAELLTKDQIGFTVRTFGVGGLFGYYGHFSSTKLGAMTWYATRQNQVVLVQLIDDKKIILTPDEPEIFLAELALAKC